MRCFLGTAILLLALTLSAGSIALAQEATPGGVTDDEVNAVAKQLYCPVCENIPLDVCPTVACAQWREQIRDQLAEGWSEEAIKDYFATQYGDRVLAEPPARGLNWLAYIVPPLALVVGAVILFRVMRSWQVSAEINETTVEPAASLNEEYLAQLEEELSKCD